MVNIAGHNKQGVTINRGVGCFLAAFVLITLGIVPVLMLWGLPALQEWTTRQRFDFIQEAEYLSELNAWYGNNSTQVNVYYWSPETITTVEAHYRNRGISLIESGDEYGNWKIGVLPNDNRNVSATNQILTHPDFCSYKETYTCLSLTILDAKQPEFFRLSVFSPSNVRLIELPSRFVQLPIYGTIIIYSYYRFNF